MEKPALWEINAFGQRVKEGGFVSFDNKVPYVVLLQKQDQELLPLIQANLNKLKGKGVLWLVRPSVMPLQEDERHALDLLGLKEKMKVNFATSWVSYIFKWELYSN